MRMNNGRIVSDCFDATAKTSPASVGKAAAGLIKAMPTVPASSNARPTGTRSKSSSPRPANPRMAVSVLAIYKLPLSPIPQALGGAASTTPPGGSRVAQRPPRTQRRARSRRACEPATGSAWSRRRLRRTRHAETRQRPPSPPLPRQAAAPRRPSLSLRVLHDVLDRVHGDMGVVPRAVDYGARHYDDERHRRDVLRAKDRLVQHIARKPPRRRRSPPSPLARRRRRWRTRAPAKRTPLRHHARQPRAGWRDSCAA